VGEISIFSNLITKIKAKKIKIVETRIFKKFFKN
jgi:hypothetical protein